MREASNETAVVFCVCAERKTPPAAKTHRAAATVARARVFLSRGLKMRGDLHRMARSWKRRNSRLRLL